MKATRYDYINFVLFVILFVVTIALYIIGFNSAENRGDIPGVTTIWLNNVYNQLITKNNLNFYGKTEYLQEYKTEAGEQFRGFIFFFLTFMFPALIAGDWHLVILFLLIALLFFQGVITNYNRLKRYVISHSDPQI